ncbi:MAG: hypothetical protein ACRCXZ_08175 [Patescibacteria group bacterium]
MEDSIPFNSTIIIEDNFMNFGTKFLAFAALATVAITANTAQSQAMTQASPTLSTTVNSATAAVTKPGTTPTATVSAKVGGTVITVRATTNTTPAAAQVKSSTTPAIATTVAITPGSKFACSQNGVWLYDIQGYDCNGIDRAGWNRDKTKFYDPSTGKTWTVLSSTKPPATINPVSSSVKPTTTVVWPYDAQGYDRNGFDTQGWNRTRTKFYDAKTGTVKTFASPVPKPGIATTPIR